MGNYSSKIDCATLDLPIPETGRIGAAPSADLKRYLLRGLTPASALGFRKCPFRSRAQFPRLFLPADFGFTIF